MRFKYIYIVLLSVLMRVSSFSQCISSGAKSPATFSTDASTGSISWTNGANVVSSNSLYATAGALIGLLSTSYTNYMLESGFGFSIPPSAAICGIQLDVQRRQQGVLIGSSVKDNSVKIIKNGLITGTEHASPVNWPSTDTYISYGGPSDTWGTSWVPADINSPNFGVAYNSASLNAGLVSLFLSAEVDLIQLTVFYDLVLPIKVSDFSADCNTSNVVLKWKAANQANTNYFAVERSQDGINFEPAGTIDVKQHLNTAIDYTLTDPSPKQGVSYYRLKETSLSGNVNYFPVISSECRATQNQLFFPNPSNGKININTMANVVIYNLNGESVYSQALSGQTEIDLSLQPKGIYFYRLISTDKIISSGKIIIE